MSDSKQRGYRVLVIDDEADIRKLLKGRLERKGHIVFEAADGKAAIEMSLSVDPEVAVCDIKMPGLDGFEVLRELKFPTILITGHGDKESAIKAVELGAFAFFEKPFDLDALEVSVRRAGERLHLEQEREALLKRLDHLCRMQDRELEKVDQDLMGEHFLGDCSAMQKVKDIVGRLTQKPKATLLITGETGTGKEVIAQELHRQTYERSERTPFLALNCAAIPRELFESELFGHEKGSFSGAHKNRIGLAEAVRTGTLFLDEIGELALEHQAKLLRLLQERRFRRVGSNHEFQFEGRIVAATHRNLPQRIKEELFREDLYYRLSIVELHLPPLRDRGDDILELSMRLCKRHGLDPLSPEWAARLRTHNWPGNIRELNNWIERASILGEFQDLSEKSAQMNQAQDDGDWQNLSDLKEKRAALLDHFDRKWITAALEECDGNVSAAAKDLGLDRKNLSRRIKELSLDSYLKKAA